MGKWKTLLIAVAVATALPAWASSGLARAQAPPPAASTSSIDAYLPQLQGLAQKGDWPDVERLARQAVSQIEAAHPDSTDLADAVEWLAGSVFRQGRAAEAEPLFRRVLVIRLKTLGPGAADTAQAQYFLGSVLQNEARYPEAELLFDGALATAEKTFGPDSANTGDILNNLGLLMEQQGRYAEAEPVLRRALSVLEKASGADSPNMGLAASNLGLVMLEQGRYTDAEALFRRALAVDEKLLGPDDPTIATLLSNIAAALTYQGRAAEAEPLLQRAAAIALTSAGSDNAAAAIGLSNLGQLLESEGRNAEAEPVLRRALAMAQASAGPQHPDTATVMTALARLLLDEGRYAEAEPLLRGALTIREVVLHIDSAPSAESLNNLATLFADEGRYPEAEQIFRNALEFGEKAWGPEHPDTASALHNLAHTLNQEGRYRDAEPLYQRALAIDEKALDPDHPYVARVREDLAGNDQQQLKFADATAEYRLACAARQSVSRAQGEGDQAMISTKGAAVDCATQLGLSLWGWAGQGGGAAAGDRPAALQLEAFGASQQAIQSGAGDALARSSALTAAASAGVGSQAQAYEAALLERDGLDQAFAKAAAQGDQGGASQRAALTSARDKVDSRIAQLTAELKSKAPLYWDYRSPSPLDVGALQARSGADAALLRPNEALVLWMVPPGADKGLVFAVSKDLSAWAQIALSGDELGAKVQALRSQVDPQGPGGQTAFDRKIAHGLYAVLLGDPAIQQVIGAASVDTLLIVPSGPLTSLPPSLLVVDEPVGADADPQALRSTHWLIRDKAIAILPAVSSLRTLRELLPQARAQSGATADLPLLAFADPDFRGDHLVPTPHSGMAVAERSIPTAQAATEEGRPKAAVLAGLPPLYGTLAEGQALARILGAPDRDLLLGPMASKTELMARQADGSLIRTRVVAFSTHGLVTGDFTGLTEPALALAHPAAHADPSDDGLLTASQAAALKLDAEWVVLSACNTASPEAPGAEGLSGLARAFFYAGADSLLVSHWRVRDDAAQRLVTETFRLRQADPKLSKAQALRRSILALLDDASLDGRLGQSFANPQAWAPFVVVGEGE